MILETEYREAIEEHKKLSKISDNKITNEQTKRQQEKWEIKNQYEKQIQTEIKTIKDTEENPIGIDWKHLQKMKEQRELKPYWHDGYKYFTNLSAGVINMSRIAPSLKNPTTLIFYLMQWRTWKDSEGRIKDGVGKRWYEKGFIISTRSQEQMALDIGVSEWTIKRWIKKLSEDRLLVIEKDGLQNIYVLGLVNKDGIKRYFYCGDTPVYREIK